MMTYDRFVEILCQELFIEPEFVSPDALLIEELGVQSIDVVQVVEQVEREMGRSLQGVDMGHVQTVEEFFWEVTAGGDDGGDSVVAGMAEAASTSDGLPHEIVMRAYYPDDPLADVDTLVAMIGRRAAVTPDRVALTFGGVETTYRDLARRSAFIASVLASHGIEHGDRVMIVMPNSAEFFAVFYGVMHLGAIAAPMFHVPQPDRIARIARHCSAKAIISATPFSRPILRRLQGALDDAEADPALLDYGTLIGTSAVIGAPLAHPEPGDVAMLQYTSGTTGNSKGVMLTHQALIANVRQMIPGGRMTRDDVFVSWLPVYHDMGLITMTMMPFYLGAKLVLLPVRLDAAAWLNAIQDEGGTFTAAPDFAYRYVLRAGGNLDRYDISSLRLALVAAEPVRKKTLVRFEEAFGIEKVLRPGYGLAEASVGVSIHDLDADDITEDEDHFVSCGPTFPGILLKLLDPETGDEVAPGTRGEICLRSPGQTKGYYRNQEATAALFTDDGYVRTGDIGYLDDDGNVYIVDRAKNIIITAGRNLAPKELEQVSDQVPGVLMSMAVGLDRGGDAGEQVHMVLEAATPDLEPARQREISREVRRALVEAMAVRPERIHVVPKGTIPRTYNGKFQYAVMRKRLREGSPTAGKS